MKEPLHHSLLKEQRMRRNVTKLWVYKLCSQLHVLMEIHEAHVTKVSTVSALKISQEIIT